MISFEQDTRVLFSDKTSLNTGVKADKNFMQYTKPAS